MRRTAALVVVGTMMTWAGVSEAKEQPLQRLPSDAWDLATVWTEPIKEVAKQTRAFDPISGLWFGILNGSVKSLERVTRLLLVRQHERPDANAPSPSDKALLRYTF